MLSHTNQTCLPALILYEMETTDWFWRGIVEGNRTNMSIGRWGQGKAVTDGRDSVTHQESEPGSGLGVV